ncbi:MAG: type II toxin-antitoxin system VapC family toxin [Puniceicoccaceae bacterium]
MAFLLDTNVLSELRRGDRCNRGVRDWAGSTRGERHYISVLSIGEIRKGIELLRRHAPQQCPAFENWLERLQSEYAAETLAITDLVSLRWGRLMAERTLPVIDGLLAATALTHHLTVVTRNVDDFADTGVPLINPFTS